MAYVFNPFTGNLDVAEQVTFDGDLTSYEKKIDSEARDQNLQDQIDAFEGDPLDDAPSDGSTYGRKDGAWEAITAGSGDVEEAPKDGTPYSRQDGTWVSAGGGNPSDGAIETITVTSPLTKTGALSDPVLGIDLSAYAEKTDLPENTSDLTNDSGFITAADVPDTSALEARVASLESELAALKDQMAKVLQDGDKIVGGVTTTDSDSGDAVFSGNIEIQL